MNSGEQLSTGMFEQATNRTAFQNSDQVENGSEESRKLRPKDQLRDY